MGKDLRFECSQFFGIKGKAACQVEKINLEFDGSSRSGTRHSTRRETQKRNEPVIKIQTTHSEDMCLKLTLDTVIQGKGKKRRVKMEKRMWEVPLV
ncbi:hypothetical protein HNY73_011133 [Argiope bruennichi]|uniref:Uncharacterized protein n=1 Tax=Argiope bruennichi TaxID=94029 RepID=A0A8T0F359_ARGBR|nr:hypothetical protein HNY73_011133 [Argiope bruennichi]